MIPNHSKNLINAFLVYFALPPVYASVHKLITPSNPPLPLPKSKSPFRHHVCIYVYAKCSEVQTQTHAITLQITPTPAQCHNSGPYDEPVYKALSSFLIEIFVILFSICLNEIIIISFVPKNLHIDFKLKQNHQNNEEVWMTSKEDS